MDPESQIPTNEAGQVNPHLAQVLDPESRLPPVILQTPESQQRPNEAEGVPRLAPKWAPKLTLTYGAGACCLRSCITNTPTNSDQPPQRVHVSFQRHDYLDKICQANDGSDRGLCGILLIHSTCDYDDALVLFLGFLRIARWCWNS